MLICQFATGQKVESQAYQLMLKDLLSHNVPEISVSDVDETNMIILDARAIEEFKVSKIQGASWVGYEDFSLERVGAIEKESKILVYCSVGYRSEKVAEKLIAVGFINVSNLYGGIFEWVNQENKVVDSQNKEVEKVHAFSKIWGIWLTRGQKVYE